MIVFRTMVQSRKIPPQQELAITNFAYSELKTRSLQSRNSRLSLYMEIAKFEKIKTWPLSILIGKKLKTILEFWRISAKTINKFFYIFCLLDYEIENVQKGNVVGDVGTWNFERNYFYYNHFVFTSGNQS